MQKIAEGNLHAIYQLNKDEVFRVPKRQCECPLFNQLYPKLKEFPWTTLKRFFIQGIAAEIDGQLGTILPNLQNCDLLVEIKPKTFLPILSVLEKNNDIKDIKNTRFYKVQVQKCAKKYNGDISQVKEEQLSKYDPRKFFSGDQADLREALIQLQETPSNNFKKTGELVISKEDLADVLSKTLMDTGIIFEMKTFFQMVQQIGLNVEEAIEAYEKLRQMPIPEDLLGGPVEFQTALFTALQFSAFQTLSDISIMAQFRGQEIVI